MAETDYRALNALAASPEDMISLAETDYHSHINSLAKQIASDPGVKIILLAGPSGSGKTTTANLLSDAIKRHGEEAMVVSLDDFYKDASDPTYPKSKNGERDYECPDALRLSEIKDTLTAITKGADFFLPKYDFKLACRVGMKKYSASQRRAVIVEGLHALNPKIADPLPRAAVLKLFVSVSTNINDGEERILSGRKLRFVRRMVRDSLYRGADARRTLNMWDEVLSAEDKYLYPYKETADIAFDTFHSFEPSVMAPFVKKLIDRELEDESPYVKTVINALRKLTEIDPRLVPENSLIREFIPGGIYESLY